MFLCKDYVINKLNIELLAKVYEHYNFLHVNNSSYKTKYMTYLDILIETYVCTLKLSCSYFVKVYFRLNNTLR